MRPAKTLRTLLAVLMVAGCAAGGGRSTQAPDAVACSHSAHSARDDLSCEQLAALEPGDIAAVEPLWTPTQVVKSPAYSLAGVIIELNDDAALRERVAASVACRGCAGADVVATLEAMNGRPALVLRSDDPETAQALLKRAEELHAGR